MDTTIEKARIYFEKAFQINLSRNLGRILKEGNWGNGTEVYTVYDPTSEEIIITKNLSKAAKLLLKIENGNAEGEICTQYHEPTPKEWAQGCLIT